MRRMIRFTMPLAAIVTVVLTAIAAMLASGSARAQGNVPPLDENTSGTYYMISYPDTTTNALDARFPNNRVRTEASVWLFSPVANRVKITSLGTSTDVLTLEPGKFKVYTFKAAPLVDVINSVSRRTATIESQYPIVVYCYFAHIQSVEAWTPIPVENWGTQYVAACVPGETVLEIGRAGETEVPHTVKPGAADILVIAAFDNTKVSLIPAGGYRFVGGPPSFVTLNKGEAFQVQSRVDTSVNADAQDDLGGSQILSDKPVGVISGNTRVMVVSDEVGLKNNAYRNMITEWMPPTEQHGTEFVYMPTWDNHRPGIGAPAERKREFARVYNATGKTLKGYYLQPSGTTQVDFSIKRDTLGEFAIGQPAAVYFKTEAPAQAMMHSSAIVKFNGSTPCFDGLPCVSFDAYAPYMVEMVPREQWTKFAPYYAPTNPGAMQNYVSVVTDTGSQHKIYRENGSAYIFTRLIPGTDLIWGTMSVSPGEDHWLESRNAGAFYGVAFGIMGGNEEYRPGGTRRKDDRKAGVAGGGGSAPGVMHPCEYEEYNAVSYGYPLAPSRRVLKPADTLQIDTVLDCTTLTIKIRAINDNPIGLRSISLDPTTVVNARLEPVDPLLLSDILGRSACTVKVDPINPLKNAEATVIIKDRTGHIWRIYYKYEAEFVELNPSNELNYGQLTVGTTTSKTVIVRNPLGRPLVVKDIHLADGNQGYKIVSITPPLQATLQPGETMTVEISSTPAMDNQRYIDTLKVKLGCTQVPLPLITETARPIISVNDVPFGTFVLGRDGARTFPMTICNIGSGELRFKNPADPDPKNLVTWLVTNFTVDPAEIAKLDTAVLHANECIIIKVTFTPTTLGDFIDTARVWASTRDVRDISVWTAHVVKPGPTVTGHDWEKQWVTTLSGCTKDKTPFYDWLITVDNVGTSDDQVASLALIDPDADAGFFRMDSSDRQTTVLAGDPLLARSAHPLKQRVLFFPKDERPYNAHVRLITVGGDTLFEELKGRGIESHGSITGIDYGRSLFKGPYPLTPAIELTATLTAKQSRPLTVDNVVVLGPNAANYWINPADLAGLPWLLQPGDTRTLRVEFRPLLPGTIAAPIAFIGDHSFCDDSTNVLTGYTFTQGVETRGWDFGTVLTCDQPSNVVTLTNTGTEPIRVKGAAFAQPTPYFKLDQSQISYPLDLAPQGTLSIPVTFMPNRTGSFSANVIFDVINPQTNIPLQPAPAEVKGSAKIITVPASIGNYRGAQGTVIDVPIVIATSPDPAKLRSFYVSVTYDSRIVRVVNGTNSLPDNLSLLKGTICEGWSVTSIPSQDGQFQAVLTAPPSGFLGGPGKILNLRFQLFLGDTTSTKLDLLMTPIAENGKECVRFQPTPGRIDIDPVCGLNYRLIEGLGIDYSLSQNKPNPFNPSTEINFSLGLDGPTRLVIYDEAGRKVTTLIDGYLKPGTYQVTWDASAYPSGLYYYRLESGDWTRTNTMILRK